MSWRQIALKHCSVVRSSNVDKKTHEGEVPVRLINYTDVYYGDRLRPTDDLMEATASLQQVRQFRLQHGDVIITKDSETPEDIGMPAFVQEGADDLVCGYHLAVIRPDKTQVDGRFLCYVMRSKRMREHLGSLARGVTRFGLRLDDIGSVQFECPALSNQRAIADYLDQETARIDGLISKKRRMIDLLEERVNSQVLRFVEESPLAGGTTYEAAPIRHVLARHEQWTSEPGEMITAFRDGEVTSRAARGREGFTNAWKEEIRVQTVNIGDVVVHGLDGFSGAIGDAQVAGVCSPVYHVCSLVDDHGDGAFYGRLLRLLALDGYLGNFAISTRERAVDFRNWDLFGRIPIPLAPALDQNRIGEAIRAIRPLRELILASERLAVERRQALITAAVTGELEIAA